MRVPGSVIFQGKIGEVTGLDNTPGIRRPGIFFTLSKKLKEKKPKFFSPQSQAYFFEKPEASGNFKHVTIFFKKPSTFLEQ